MRFFWLISIASFVLLSASASTAQPAWPRYNAKYLRIEKAPLTVAPWNMEPVDPDWAHLHSGHHIAIDSSRVTFQIRITTDGWDSFLPIEQSNIDVRYTVHGVPVSDWIAPGGTGERGFTFTLDLSNPALASIPNGFHDVSVEVRQRVSNGRPIAEFKPYRIFLHLVRGHAPVSPIVPIITNHHSYKSNEDGGPGVVYVDTQNLNSSGYPANPAVSSWTDLPHAADLYLESLTPTGEYNTGAQMRWWDPPHPGQAFFRAMNSNHGQAAHGSSGPVGSGGGGHSRLPFKDGPRGIGWLSPYISGQVDLNGRFFFAEDGAGVRVLEPNGHIKTVAGRRVKPGFEPIWIQKPLDLIFDNTHIVGQWENGFVGFHEGQKDVAFDPANPSVLFVASQFDHCIWKVVVHDIDRGLATVSVFAGDPNHTSGHRDGPGLSARFNEPYSLAYDPVSRMIYVADKNNDAIRVINPATSQVGTLFGQPGMTNLLRSRGVSDPYNRTQVRPRMKIDVSAAEAAGGIRPEIYRPQAVRVASDGQIVLLSIGDGLIRRIRPATGESATLATVDQSFNQYLDGWAWIDVARYGTTGPRDGVYWLKSTGEGLDGGRHFNEMYAWVPITGGPSKAVVTEPWIPHPTGFGLRSATQLPHYPWAVAVDPRGSLLFTGFGDHGIVRLRKRESGDPVPSKYLDVGFQEWKTFWQTGNGEGTPAWSSTLRGFPFALAYGWNGHNYIGMPDGWGLRGTEDCDARARYFKAPAEVMTNAGLREYFCKFTELTSGPLRDKAFAVPSPTATSSPSPLPSVVPTETPSSEPTVTPTPLQTVSPTIPGPVPSPTVDPRAINLRTRVVSIAEDPAAITIRIEARVDRDAQANPHHGISGRVVQLGGPASLRRGREIRRRHPISNKRMTKLAWEAKIPRRLPGEYVFEISVTRKSPFANAQKRIAWRSGR